MSDDLNNNELFKLTHKLTQDVVNKRPWGLRYLAGLVEQRMQPDSLHEDMVMDHVMYHVDDNTLLDTKRNRPFFEMATNEILIAYVQATSKERSLTRLFNPLTALVDLLLMDRDYKIQQREIILILNWYLLSSDMPVSAHAMRFLMTDYDKWLVEAKDEDELILQAEATPFYDAVMARNPMALYVLMVEFTACHDFECSGFENHFQQFANAYKKQVMEKGMPLDDFLQSEAAVNVAQVDPSYIELENDDTLRSMVQMMGLFIEVEDECYPSQVDGFLDFLGHSSDYRQKHYEDIAPMASVLMNWEMTLNNYFRRKHVAPEKIANNG